MKKISILATLLSIIFLSGCDSPPWISENHEEDFREVFSKGLSNDQGHYNVLEEVCKGLGNWGGIKAEFNEFNLVSNTVEKNQSTIYGTPVNIKKAQYNSKVNLYCWHLRKPNSDYYNIPVGGEVSIYQEVSEVNGETFKGEWKLYAIEIIPVEY